jgi:NAD-dependent dihydropyrimidine dehydrogenase PreA subunit
MSRKRVAVARPDPKDCKQTAGVVRPVIDSHRCEAKDDCVRVCPFDVFEVRPLSKAEKKALPLIPWIKVMAHGGKQGFVVQPDACHACGACVAACPEKAIRLTRDA